MDHRSGDGANENPGFISDEVDTTYISSEQFWWNRKLDFLKEILQYGHEKET